MSVDNLSIRVTNYLDQIAIKEESTYVRQSALCVRD